MYTLKELVEQRKKEERIQQEAMDKENKQKFEELLKYLYENPTEKVETKNQEVSRMAKEFGLCVTFRSVDRYTITIPKELE